MHLILALKCNGKTSPPIYKSLEPLNCGEVKGLSTIYRAAEVKRKGNNLLFRYLLNNGDLTVELVVFLLFEIVPFRSLL